MASTANRGRLILVVEDETAIVRGITVALARAGFRAMVAENDAAGLEAFLAELDAIDLVLADVVMPVMDGITMVRDIRKVRLIENRSISARLVFIRKAAADLPVEL